MSVRDPRAFPAALGGAEPGVNAAFVRLPSVCLLCARVLLPGDWRWVCRDCWVAHGMVRLRDLVLADHPGEPQFSPQVTPVWASSEVTE